MGSTIFENFGNPALQIKGFRLWIHDRQSHYSRDYWDANWLIASIHCIDNERETQIISEPFLRTDELSQLIQKLISILGSTTRIDFETMEPFLSIESMKISVNKYDFNLYITPHLWESNNKYEFKWELNESDLQAVISDLKKILVQYPVIGKP